MKKKMKHLIPAMLVVCIVLVFCVVTGGKRYDVALTDYEVTQDEKVIVLDVLVPSSMGYVRTLTMVENENKALITFYSTYGLNSSFGANHLFPIELSDNCTEIYFVRADGELELVLQKSSDNGWQRP